MTGRKAAAYLALELDAESRRRLLDSLPVRHRVNADHVTLHFDVPEDDPRRAMIGMTASVLAIGWAEDDRAQVVAVDVGNLSCSNQPAHVTIALVAGVEGVYARELLRSVVPQPIPSILLNGTVRLRLTRGS